LDSVKGRDQDPRLATGWRIMYVMCASPVKGPL
jgi:hypothetical protein